MSTHKSWIGNELTLLMRINKSFSWRRSNPASKRWGHLQYLLEEDDLSDIAYKCFEDILRLGVKENGPHRKCLEHFDGSVKDTEVKSRAAQRYMNIAISNWIKLEYDNKKNRKMLNKQIAWEIEEWNMHRVSCTLFDIIGNIQLTEDEKVIIQWKMDLIDDIDAMRELDCSERTLYNRWNKLREKILQRYNSAPLKSLELFSRVHEIPIEMEGE